MTMIPPEKLTKQAHNLDLEVFGFYAIVDI